MNRKIIISISLLIIFSTVLSISISVASPQQTELSDDISIYSTATSGEVFHYANVQPGNYTVIGMRTAHSDGGMELYADASYTQKIRGVYIDYSATTIKWNEVGFVTVDGISLSSVTPYYVSIDGIGTGLYVEMENGEATGVIEIDVNDSVDGSFSGNEVIDAYQIYLEIGLTYRIILDVPGDKTFDLFLCKGISDSKSAIGYSHVDNLGADESITRSVPASGYYCIVVTNPDWTSGDYTLSVEVLQDDSPVYSSTYQGCDSYYALPVQPGKYTVVGIRSVDNKGELDLYSDSGCTVELSKAYANYEDDEVKWDEVSFFTIDGTDLSNVTPYYMKIEDFCWHIWLEMENGENTGMVSLNVNDSASGSFSTSEVFDAYHLYLETGFTYNITLDVPADKTFDLFVCHGISNEDSAAASSHSDTLGVDETIKSFLPTATGYYCIVVTNPDWTSGDYTLSVQGSSTEITSETSTTTSKTTGATESQQTPFSGYFSVFFSFFLVILIKRKRKRI